MRRVKCSETGGIKKKKIRTVKGTFFPVLSSFKRIISALSCSELIISFRRKMSDVLLWIPGMFPDTRPLWPRPVSAVINLHRCKLPPIPNDGRKRGVKE